MMPTEVEVEEINIGMLEKPRVVKISKYLSPEMKGKYATLMTEFVDVFAWDYTDMKVYDKIIIQHTSP